MKFAIPVLVAFSLSSCVSSRPQFAEATTPHAATITIRTSAKETNISVVSYSGDEYLETKGQVVTLLNSKAIGYDFSDQKTIRVQPDNPFRFSIRIGNISVDGNMIEASVCMTHTSFTPLANENYVVLHEKRPNGCATTVMHEQNGKLVPESSAKPLASCLDPSIGYSSFRTACKAGFTFQ